MTQTEWKTKTEDDMRELAREISKNITIRSYNDGNSCDTTRESTTEEAKAIFGIIYAAMWAYSRDEADLPSILNTAEITGHYLISETEQVNCYDTIYCPLQRIMGKWA